MEVSWPSSDCPDHPNIQLFFASRKGSSPFSIFRQHTPVPPFPHPQFFSFCKSQLTSPAHKLVIAIPIVSTVQFRHNKIEQIWLPWELEPGLQRWELDVITTTLPFTVMCQTRNLTFSYSSPCTRHFSLPHDAPVFNHIYPLGGEGRHV